MLACLLWPVSKTILHRHLTRWSNVTKSFDNLSVCRGTFASSADAPWCQYDSVTCCHLFPSITRFFDCEWLNPLIRKFLSTESGAIRDQDSEWFCTNSALMTLMTLMLQRVNLKCCTMQIGPGDSEYFASDIHFSTSEMSWRIEGFDLTTWKIQRFIISFW